MRSKDFHQLGSREVRGRVRLVSNDRELLGLSGARQERDPHQQHEDSSPVYHNGAIVARVQLPGKGNLGNTVQFFWDYELFWEATYWPARSGEINKRAVDFFLVSDLSG
jgi:hypothetical protein